MCLLTDESKKHIKKKVRNQLDSVKLSLTTKTNPFLKWSRLTSSIWTKLFTSIFIVQFCLVVFFQSRILLRNYSVYNDGRFIQAYSCNKGDGTDKYLFAISAIQSGIFMALQLYLIYFCLNAIFHEHIIQIITLVILAFGSAGYSLVQLLQLKLRIDRIQNDENCNSGFSDFDTNWLQVDLPQVLTLTVISIISAIVASKLYYQFGWNIYKKIGGDYKIQRIYRNNLVFLMLLKLNLFFWIIYIVPTVIVAVRINDFNVDNSIVDIILIAYHSSATLLALVLQILAYRSIRRESVKGMIAFSVLWLFIVIDYGVLIYAFVRLLVLGTYFMIIFTSVFVLIALTTFIYSIIVTANFGKGLKEIVENFKKRSRPRPMTIDTPTLVLPTASPSSSVYSPEISATSQQLPPSSSLSDTGSNVSDEKRNKQDDNRWIIDD